MAAKLFSKTFQGEPGDWSGFIDEGVRLEGTLESKGSFRIDGQVKGTVISPQTLTLGEKAKVEGQIEGDHVVVAGRFEGVLTAKARVEILPKAVVTGEVHTPCLVIEPGGILDGHCHMLASAEAGKALTIPIRAANRT